MTLPVESGSQKTPTVSRRIKPESMLLHVSLLLVAGILLTAALITAAWPLFGRPAGVGDRLDLVKVVLAIVGGTGAVVALTVAYRRQRHGELAAEEERYKAFTDRYVKAAEQLGHDKPAVRVSGVYAMAELADDWEAGRQLCIDVLCAYIRIPGKDLDEGEGEVRRTLFRIIRDHLRPEAHWSRVKWCQYRFSFEGATIGSADLSGSHLAADGHMTFYGVRFTDGILLSGLVLQSGARMWFIKVTFAGGYASFDSADFRGSKVQFDRAEFAGGRTTFAHVLYDVVEDQDASAIDVGITRVGVTCTGGTVDWGTLPPLP